MSGHQPGDRSHRARISSAGPAEGGKRGLLRGHRGRHVTATLIRELQQCITMYLCNPAPTLTPSNPFSPPL